MSKLWFLVAWIVLLIWADAQACLRDQLDARSIQWASLIVKATLIDTQITKSPSTHPSKVSKTALYQFRVDTVFDGVSHAGDIVTVARFLGTASGGVQSCNVPLDDQAKGKGFVLVLRRADACTLPKGATVQRPKETFVPVLLIDAAEFDADAATDLKRLIADTRKSESEATDQQIIEQVHAAGYAEDETEAAEAEAAVIEMATRALPELNKQMTDAPPAGKTRLRHLIEELTPPTVPVETEPR